MGFVRSPDCYLDLHQISAIHYTNTHAQFDSAGTASRICQSEVWYGQATGCLKSEREEPDEDRKCDSCQKRERNIGEDNQVTPLATS